MPRIKVNFALKDDDWQRYQEMVSKYPTKVKQVVNEYFHNNVKNKMIKSITLMMPRSDRLKKPERGHAKDSNWFVSFNFDQAITIENKLAGTRKTSFYYLFFPHEGTSKILKPNPFMEKAIDKNYDSIVNGLFAAIEKEIN